MSRLSLQSPGNGTLRQPVLPQVQTWDPQSTGLLGAESIWCKARLEHHACLSSEWHSVNMSIFKSSSGRSARFVSAWSGGEVELIILINSGMEATQLLRRPRRRLAQKPMAIVAIVAIVAIRYIREGCEYPETPIKNSTADKCGRTRPRIA